MASAFRLICYALLAVPTYWTADKLLQIYATSIAKDRVLAQVQDEKYLSQLFSIPLPFQYADYIILEGKSLKKNEISKVLEYIKGTSIKPFKLYFEYTDGIERKQWYEYPTDGCEVNYCTYDPALLRPMTPPDKINFTSVFREKRIETQVLLYSIHVYISLSAYSNGKIIALSAEVSNKGRNPVDRTIRQLAASSEPEFWQTKWRYTANAVTGAITEEDY